jgi:diguanylate cyclase (GGDEF)-like protein
MTTIQNFFTEKIKLPSPPAIALKILEAVRQEDNFDELARIISADPALTARILRIANSSFYNFQMAVESLQHATAMIGTNELKNIALSFVIVDKMQNAPQGSFDLQLFWQRSITAAVAADMLGKKIGVDGGDLFVCGLLQDIGVLLLYLSDPVGYAALRDEKRVSGRTTWEAEKIQFGRDHTDVGSYLLQIWKLPPSIYEPIHYHHAQSVDENYRSSAQIINLSGKIAGIYYGAQRCKCQIEAHRMLTEQYNFTNDQANNFLDRVSDKTREILDFFSIDPGNIKPFSVILQEANDELKRLNYSYGRIVLELEQAKQNAEQLAIELKLANDSLRELVFRDGLTGLYNHRYFQEILEAELERCRRYKHSVSLLMLDIDFFKQINDSYGHPAGDHVLKVIADRIVKLVRRCDIVARYGGEEFAVILPETSATSAKVIAQRIRRGIEQLDIFYNEQKISVTTSCGATGSEMDSHETTRQNLIKRADEALYTAKKNGRNRVEINDAVKEPQ